MRFLIILAIILYVLYKIGSFFFRAGVASQQPRSQRNFTGQPNNTNAGPNQQKKGKAYQEGEYIDYEEVK